MLQQKIPQLIQGGKQRPTIHSGNQSMLLRKKKKTVQRYSGRILEYYRSLKVSIYVLFTGYVTKFFISPQIPISDNQHF